MDVKTGQCFRVDSDTDNLTEADLADYADEIEKADRKELQSFVDIMCSGSDVRQKWNSHQWMLLGQTE